MTFVNHGRWIVTCDTKYCAGARLAEDTETCTNCGQPTVTAYPTFKALIDVALARRIVETAFEALQTPVDGPTEFVPTDTAKEKEGAGVS